MTIMMTHMIITIGKSYMRDDPYDVTMMAECHHIEKQIKLLLIHILAIRFVVLLSENLFMYLQM